MLSLRDPKSGSTAAVAVPASRATKQLQNAGCHLSADQLQYQPFALLTDRPQIHTGWLAPPNGETGGGPNPSPQTTWGLAATMHI